MSRHEIVVATYLPGETPRTSLLYQLPTLCEDDYDYWRALAAHWDSSATIVNVEHDLEVTDNHFRALFACGYPLCTWAYRCHWVTSGVADGVIGAGPVRGQYLDVGEEWASWTAIGLVKITPEARIAPLRREWWGSLELAVEDAVSGLWHVHWPEVTHHHW